MLYIAFWVDTPIGNKIRSIHPLRSFLVIESGGVNAYTLVTDRSPHPQKYHHHWYPTVAEAQATICERSGMDPRCWLFLGAMFPVYDVPGNRWQTFERIDPLVRCAVRRGWLSPDYVRLLHAFGVQHGDEQSFLDALSEMVNAQFPNTIRETIATPHVRAFLEVNPQERIAAIKLHRYLTMAGLRESKDRVYALADEIHSEREVSY
ncbi:MAG: hypothetical protein AAF125_12250 [Chloroflexota bacterium]